MEGDDIEGGAGQGTAVREHLLGALEADLVGPYALGDEGAGEVLRLRPSRWYLTGFLAPKQGREEDADDPDQDETLDAGSDDPFAQEQQEPEAESRRKNFFPASIGMSVLLPAGAREVTATVSFAEYVDEQIEIDEGGKRRKVVHWRRVAVPPKTVTVPLREGEVKVAVPDSPGLMLRGKVGAVASPEAQGLAAGTQALSLFLVNERTPEEDRRFTDRQYLFQVELALEHEAGLVARPNRTGEGAGEWDDRVADLQYRERCEHAVGHGVAVQVPAGQAPVTRVHTVWLPRAEVRKVRPGRAPDVETSMDALAALADGAAVRPALGKLVEAYGRWIESQRAVSLDSAERRDTREVLMDRADEACRRMEAGIALLEEDAQALEAFRVANEAMARAARQQRPDDAQPRWRLFQLGFVLLNLVGIARPEHADRQNVELIFFPTGGGKTEAYLGLIAFTLVLRRLRGRERSDGGLGVAVLLRYTLRLLTLDQLGRAATLVCALELIRRERGGALGDTRFACGLWVGRSATANTMADVKRKVTDFKNSAGRDVPSPFPLTHCPWCREEIKRDSFDLKPTWQKPTEVVVGCANFRCAFAAAKNPEGLPVLFVDEQIYRELPAFVIATVDKFAMMPWRGETGMLFGRALAREGRRFFGPLDGGPPKGAKPLPEGLLPPELIVQDELHLISGPLGTMVGLYETAIEALCNRPGPDGGSVGPKIVASTATVRRAAAQVRALFGRDAMALFPPPGVDESETFFAEVDRDQPGRLYVGVAAQARSMKAILLRAYIDLLAAANKAYDPKGDPRQTADGYMTLAGYFNSLRELGGMRRLVEDEVRARVATADERLPESSPKPHRWLAARTIQPEPVELTSREHTGKIAESKARLALPFTEKSHVDVLLASNMISVGVDIDRLGLMVVAGQPKTTSEYIQASSRVGRQAAWPGLVVTCFNLHKPRDRSHYERFTAYHESFYRFVEAQSLTPFSTPALDRGLAGTLVAMTRLGDPALTPPLGANLFAQHREAADRWVEALADRVGRHRDEMSAEECARMRSNLRMRARNLFDVWEQLACVMKEGEGKRSYSRYDRDNGGGKPFLHTALDEPPDVADERKFTAPTSMRDVEPTVHLWMERRQLGGDG